MAQVSDTFARSDELLTASPDWDDLPFNDAGTLQIVSNEAVLNAAGGWASAANISAATAQWVGTGQWGRHQKASMTIGDTIRHAFGVLVYVSGDGFYVGYYHADNFWRINRYLPDGSGGLQEDFGPVAESSDETPVPASGDTLTLEVSDDGSGGSLLQLYHNDSIVVEVTDNDDPLTSGQPGLMLGEGSGDEPTATDWNADDFEDGVVASDDFSGSGALTDSENWELPSWGSNSPIMENGQVRGDIEQEGHSARWIGEGNFGRRQRARVTLGPDNSQANQGSISCYMGSHGGYNLNVNYGTGQFDITRYDAGADSYTVLASLVWNTAPVSGDIVEIEVNATAQGYTSIIARHNSTQIMSYTDDSSNRHDEGRPGLLLFSTGMRFSDFGAQAYGDVTLSNPTVNDLSDGGFNFDVTTSVDDGNLYVVVTQSSTIPSRSQVKQGRNHQGNDAVVADSQSVSSSGDKSFEINTFNPGSAYYVYAMHETATGIQSVVITSGRILLEGASAVVVVRDDQGNVVADLSGIEWWSSDSRDRAPSDSGDDGSTNENGELSVQIPNSNKSDGQTVIIEAKLPDGRYGEFEATVQ